jgi:uncharacterized protein YecE (DUF72 family)
VASFQKERGVVHLGTMGWSYSFWVGKLYSDDTKPDGFLTEYSKHFNSVEIDSTFYRIPSVSTIEGWKNQVPTYFKFSPKFPQAITHAPGFAYDLEKLNLFINRITLLGERLGPLLLQFPPNLKMDHIKLGDLLDALPTRQLYAVEFRNRSWFTDETFNMLRDKGVALTLTNKLGHLEENTARFTYIRWEGDRKTVNGEKGVVEIDRRSETTEWVEKVAALLENGIDVYGFFSKYYSGFPPEDVNLFNRLLKNRNSAVTFH